MTGVRDLDHRGVKWMGELPSSWAAHPVKRHFSVQLGKMLQNHESGEGDRNVPYLKALHVQWGRVIADELPEMWASPSDLQQYGVRAGDLLVCEGGEVGRAAIVEAPPATCIIQNALHRVRPRDSSDVRFLQYVLHAVSTSGWFDVLCNRATIAHFTGEKLAELRIPLPPLNEQRAIATRLDREMARVDALIEKKRRQIELLQEKRSAVIRQAVTRGLDPKIKMKDSRIAWLGSVPAHWPIVRLGYFAQVRNGSTPSQANPEYWIEGTVPWLSSGKVNEDVITEPSAFITEQARRDCGLRIVPKGSVVIGLVGQGRTRGLAALMGMDAAINQNMAAVIPGPRLMGRFVQYLFQHMYGPIREIGRGANQAALNCELVSDIRIPLPPISEQQALVSHLELESQSCLAIQSHIQRSLGLLQEYRSTLISATVTGKIRVGDEVPNLQRPLGDSGLTVGQSVSPALREPR